MAILGKIESVCLVDISGGGDCCLENYGCMRDVVLPLNCEFISGNIYGVIGEFGDGGWALSTMLAGINKWEDYGSILANDKKIRNNEMKKYSCYVGADSGIKKMLGLLPMTVKEQIIYGIKKGLSYDNDIEQIREKFSLSNERFNRYMKFVSGERWKASMAIGYAMGKSIYCFPWLNTKRLIQLEEHISICSKVLLDVGSIIIIPTTKQETLLSISSRCKFIFLEDKQK